MSTIKSQIKSQTNQPSAQVSSATTDGTCPCVHCYATSSSHMPTHVQSVGQGLNFRNQYLHAQQYYGQQTSQQFSQQFQHQTSQQTVQNTQPFYGHQFAPGLYIPQPAMYAQPPFFSGVSNPLENIHTEEEMVLVLKKWFEARAAAATMATAASSATVENIPAASTSASSSTSSAVSEEQAKRSSWGDITLEEESHSAQQPTQSLVQESKVKPTYASRVVSKPLVVLDFSEKVPTGRRAKKNKAKVAAKSQPTPVKPAPVVMPTTVPVVTVPTATVTEVVTVPTVPTTPTVTIPKPIRNVKIGNLKQTVFILIGLPGSGKTAFCQLLMKSHLFNFIRQSPNDYASSLNAFDKYAKETKEAKEVENKFGNRHIIIDRYNQNEYQRSLWINKAKEYNMAVVFVWLKTPRSSIMANLIESFDGDEQAASRFLHGIEKSWEDPTKSEDKCISNLFIATDYEKADALAETLLAKARS